MDTRRCDLLLPLSFYHILHYSFYKGAQKEDKNVKTMPILTT